MENVVFLRDVAILHLPHVLDGVAPLLTIIRELHTAFSGGKFTQIYQKKRHLLRKNFVPVILQHHILHEIITPRQLPDAEIHQDYRNDRRVVVHAVPSLERTADNTRCVGDDPVLQELLAGLLHLHDDVVPVLVGTEHIEYQTLFLVGQAELLRLTVGNVSDWPDIWRQKGVEEMNQVLLLQLGAEDALETEVGQQVDVLGFVVINRHDI